jgi:putative ABC transport system permease protein
MPDWSKEVRIAIAELGLNPAQEAALVEELAQHLSDRYDEFERGGTDDAEACRLLREELNDGRLITELKPILSSARPPVPVGLDGQKQFFAGLGKDLRLALRLLRLNPGFATVAVLSLALGIGANTAIFHLLDAVLLRTLPVRSPQQLADIELTHQGRIGSSVARQKELSTAIWEQLRQRQQAFSLIAAWSTERFDLRRGGEAQYADGLWVSGSFFQVLQVNPVLGRLFSQSDDYRGCGIQGVVISDAFWHRQFGGRANVLESKLSLSGHLFQFIGVTPPSFYGLEVGRNFDVALPLCSESALREEKPWTDSATTWWLAAIGRLKPDWTFKRASAELAAISPSIFAATLPSEYDEEARKNYLRFGLRAIPAATGVSSLRKEYADPLRLLLATSGLVLLIACANLANLMLARASSRQREMALRLTLGASRARLIHQLLAESLLLAMIGAAIGAVFAEILGRLLVVFISTSGNPIFLPLSLDLRVLSFTVGLAVFTCLLFGVAPAFRAASTDPGTVMKTSGRGLTAGRERFVLRRGLIVFQVALSLVLLIAALLFVRTFRNLLAVNAGFQQDDILVADFDASPLRLPVERRREYERELLASVRSAPGVVSAAETAIVPISGNAWNEFIDIPGTAIHRKLVDFNESSSGYFRTLETPLLAGRDFNDEDTPTSPPVSIVNESFARILLGNLKPIGESFGVTQPGGRPDKMYQIIGLVGNTKYMDLREDFKPIIFVAEDQDGFPDPDSTILIRSNESLPSLISSLKYTAARVNPDIILNFSVLRASIREGLVRERLMATLSGFYGVLAAILSMVGLFGIISYTVVRRRNEIGVRIALGATKSNILSMILREAVALVGTGLVIGTVLAAAAGSAAQAMLFGLKPTDPFTWALAIGALTIVAVAASVFPAVGAIGVHPMQVLREE